MTFNVFPCFLTLAPELVNVPGDRKIINEVDCCACMIERHDLDTVGVTDLHEFCVLRSPSITKQPVYLGCKHNFHNAVCNVVIHPVKRKAILHAKLTGDAEIPVVQDNQLFRPSTGKSKSSIYLHFC